MKNNIYILLIATFFSTLLISCDVSSPNKIEPAFRMTNLTTSIFANKLPNSDSIQIVTNVKFNFSFENCFGTIESFGMSLPMGMSYGGAIDAPMQLSNEIYLWEDSTSIYTTDEVPDNFSHTVSMQGTLYKKENEKYIFIENYSESLTKNLVIIKNY